MKRPLSLIALSLLLLLAATAAFAQTGGASLAGRVTDESGGALPGVTVTATQNATGFSRSVVTGSDGSYRFASLPVGTYNVNADLSGFASVTTRNVELNVSQERELNITLKQAAVKEQITVTASSPLVETTPAVSTVVSQREIENLPLNGRQFANLGSLAPGTTLSVNSDPTKARTVDDRAQRRQRPQREFHRRRRRQHRRHHRRRAAELQHRGRSGIQHPDAAVQGRVRPHHRRRADGRHQDRHEQLRRKRVRVLPRQESELEQSNSEKLGGGGKAPYKRNQYGASFGGPIIKDRAHFFVTGERNDQKTSYIIGTAAFIRTSTVKRSPRPSRTTC